MRLTFTGLVDEIDFLLGLLMSLIFTRLVDEIDFY